MKSLLRILYVIVIYGFTLANVAGGEAQFPRTFLTYENAYSHMNILSSDEMKGRDTPSPELDSAAAYIARKFSSYGVSPIHGQYYHTYSVKEFDLGSPTALNLHANNIVHKFQLKNDFIPFSNSGEGRLSGESLVFAGFGWVDSSKKYDDFASIDVRDKIVVMIGGMPAFGVPRQTSEGEGRERGIRTKVHNAQLRGARGVIIFSNPLLRMKLRPVGYPFPSLYPALSGQKMPLVYDDGKVESMPVVHAGENVASLLFGSVESLRSLVTRMDSLGIPQSFDFDKNIKVENFTVTFLAKKTTVKNVMGIIKGAKSKGEYIVIGAHYDHVGFSRPQSTQKDSIFNGADDNASGTTGLLLLAQSMATIANDLERDIVFVAFSGEEKGLYGSRAFVETSPLPLQQCVAMFNMDMIGRNDSNTLSVGGNSRCRELAELNEKENQKMSNPFIIKYDAEQFFFRSDQANFAKKKIPVLFYFSGEHADYHKVTDEISKINFDKLLRITELCGRTAVKTANLQVRLPYLPQKGDE